MVVNHKLLKIFTIKDTKLLFFFTFSLFHGNPLSHYILSITLLIFRTTRYILMLAV